MSLKTYLLPGTRTALTDILADSDTTNDQLVAIIKTDPLLTWQLYTVARENMADKHRSIQSINHIINLFGFSLLKTTLAGKQEWQADNKALDQCLAIAFYTAHLSSALLPEKHGTVAERFFLPSLVFTMELTNHYHQQKNPQLSSKPPKEALAWLLAAEQTVHKTSLDIHLPTLTERTLALKFDQQSPWLKEMRRASHQPEKVKALLEQSLKDKRFFDNQETGIYLITHSLIALFFDKQGKYQRRFFSLLAAHLEKTPEQINDELLKHAKSFESKHFGAELSLTHQLNKQQWFSGEPGIENDANLADPEFFDACLAQLTNNDGNFSKVQLLDLARSAIIRGLGAETCTLLIFNQQTQLKTLGKDDRQIIIEKKQLGPLFTQLLNKTASQQLKQENLASAFNSLPSPWLKDWQPKPSSFATIAGKRPLGIAYADHHAWETVHHQHFTTVCKFLNKALEA